jgi:hypothetical protein
MTEFVNNLIDKEPLLDEKEVGKKEFIVKQDIVISVQYKILAEDKDEAYEKMLNEYMFELGVTENDDNRFEIYDFQTKNHGAQQRKEFWTDKLLPDIEKTGKDVKKIYSEEKEIDGKPNPDYDEKDFELKVTDVPW